MLLTLTTTTRDVEELLSSAYAHEKAANSQLFAEIYFHSWFPSITELRMYVIQGHGNATDWSFYQLLELTCRGEEDERVRLYLCCSNKKFIITFCCSFWSGCEGGRGGKFTSHDIQNELAKMIANTTCPAQNHGKHYLLCTRSWQMLLCTRSWQMLPCTRPWATF